MCTGCIFPIIYITELHLWRFFPSPLSRASENQVADACIEFDNKKILECQIIFFYAGQRVLLQNLIFIFSSVWFPGEDWLYRLVAKCHRANCLSHPFLVFLDVPFQDSNQPWVKWFSHLYVILFYGILWFSDLVNRRQKLSLIPGCLKLSFEIYLRFKIYLYSKSNEALMGFISILRFVFFKKSFSLTVKIDRKKDFFFLSFVYLTWSLTLWHLGLWIILASLCYCVKFCIPANMIVKAV